MFSALRAAWPKGRANGGRALWRYRDNRSRRCLHTDEAGTTSSQSYLARRESWFSPAMMLLGFMPVFTFALGTWQVQRLQWKVALIDELEEKLRRDPILLPKQINLSALPEFVFRRVRLKGRWDHDRSILLGPRVREGVHGYHVVTPLVRPDGSTVLVDRGFISKDWADHYDRSENGDVEVLGMLRTSPKRNRFTPDNHPEKGQWYWADVDAMAEQAGGESVGVQPVFIEHIFDGHSAEAASLIKRGIPVGRPATVDLRNAHLSYVLTWYSLSAFTAAMLANFMLKRRVRNRSRSLPR